MPLPRSFYFIRHGETDWNKAGRFQGVNDIPLNETGLQQARDAANKVRNLPITHVISSPLDRALTTARLLAEPKGWVVKTEHALRERHFGLFEGKTRDEICTLLDLPDMSAFTDAHVPGDAETMTDVAARVVPFIKKALHELPGEVLFVAHGGVFRSLTMTLQTDRLLCPNAKPMRFEKTGDTWRVISL